MYSEFHNFDGDLPVLVIGSAGVDIVGRITGELQSGSSTPGTIRSSFGGVARNVVENLARLGQRVILLTAVGKDHNGDKLLQKAEEVGINTDYCIRTDEYPTGMYIALQNQKSDLLVAIDDMRASSAISKSFIVGRAKLFEEASMVFFDANLPKETLKTIVTMAKRARLKICTDPTSAALATRLKPYLSRFFLVTANNTEAAVFCHSSKPIVNRKQALSAAKNLVTQGVEIAIVTMAELGLCYATSETNGHIPAIKTDVLDPTGAGDALIATIMFSLLNNIPVDDAVRLGVSAASLTLRTLGAVIPDLTLEKLYDHLVI